MTAPVGAWPPTSPAGKAGAPTKASYCNRLLADFHSLLLLPQGLALGAPEQPGCNQRTAHSDAAAAETRPFAATAPEFADSAAVVDPLALSLAAPSIASSGATDPPAPAPGVSLPSAGVLDQVLAAEVLQRVAWGGDRRRGVARLELAGELAGAVVVVRGEGREVALELSLPAGCAPGLPERLSARLAARGLVVRSVVVK